MPEVRPSTLKGFEPLAPNTIEMYNFILQLTKHNTIVHMLTISYMIFSRLEWKILHA